tara:strand:- start:529 stop:2394 length:1866 start_codon:yes stop_codon:yes gene_type:complete
VEFVLDKFQEDAIKSLHQNLNVLVVAPTGSGKTLIAEKAVDKYISDGLNVIYTTPIKALSNQKYNDFNNLGIETGLLTGDRTINPDASLIIGTTEILRNMIFSNDKRLENIGMIILDEVHYLGDSERGTTWEEIIIHLPNKIKLLSLSATIENKNEFLDWLVSLRGPTHLVESSIRPVPLDVELVATENKNEKIYTIKSSKNNKNKRTFRFQNRYLKHKKPLMSNQINYLDSKELTPTIFFYFSRDRVESKARQATTTRSKQKNNTKLKEIFNSVFNSLDDEEYNLLNLDELYWMWTRRIAFHHAGLAPIVKEFIEYLFLNRFIDILFATETLALGLNLPAKSIVIDSPYKYDGIKTRLISQSEFLQLTGRAGRRGIDTKGYAFINYDKNIDIHWYDKLFTLKPSILSSSFAITYSSILNLTSKYETNEAIELINKSFYSYQNNFDTKELENIFRSKLEILKELNYFESDLKRKILTETYRDTFIPGLEIINNNNKIEFYLMFICSGLSNSKYDFSMHDKHYHLYTKFIIAQEQLNKLESFNGLKNRTTIEVSWFSVFNEYLKTQNLEYVINKFNLNIGDFIRTAKEASELSLKMYNIFNIDEFDQINKMFKNKLIQKTML